MKKLVLGLDVGITSVGWGLLDIENNTVVDCGVRIFEEGTASKNIERRSKRGSRRLIRRRQLRLLDLRKLLLKNNIISDVNFKLLENPYAIRVKGLSQKLTNEKVATAILSIARRRGSSFELVEEDPEKAKEAQSTKAILNRNEYELRTRNLFICELLLEKLQSGEKIRGADNAFKSESYKKELDKLLETQGLSIELSKEIINIIFRKRNYYDGPGSCKSPTPYGRYFIVNGVLKKVDLIEKMRGKCSVFTNELRAPKMSYKADLFNLLNDLNNLRINGDVEITPEIKKTIIDNYINKNCKITPYQLAKLLGVKLEHINGFRIDKSQKPLLTEFKGYKKIKDIVDKNDLDTTIYENKVYLDQVIEILTRVKGIEDRKNEIKNIDSQVFDEKALTLLAEENGITQYHALSEKAIDLLIPDLLETNDNQMQLLVKSGLYKSSEEIHKGNANIIADKDAILSPVAKRAQNEALKIINSVRKKYGELDSIVIEMARDRNSDDEKKRLRDEQKRGEDLNKEAEELVKGFNVNLNPKLRQKIRLYKEQEGKCIYCGEAIDIKKMIFDPEMYEIDHILPISISFDDSMANKVLVHKIHNHLKSNKSPFGYFTSGKAKGWSYDEFEAFSISLHKNRLINKKKLAYLLEQRDITKFDVMKEFINRNLVDTRYASKVILNTISDYYRANNIDTKVHTIRGNITSLFRKITRIEKDRDESYHHHAVDALIVAGLKKSKFFNKLFDYKVNKDGIVSSRETGEVIDIANEKEFFDSDLIKFIQTLRKAIIIPNNQVADSKNGNILNVKISHKVDRKPNRQFTNETIYGVRNIDGINYVMGKYKDIYGPEGKKVAKKIASGDDDNLLIKQNDEKSYLLLKEIVAEYYLNEDKNPFEEYRKDHGFIRKYSKKGNGPIIKSLKYIDSKLGSHVDITKKYIKDSPDVKVVLLSVKPYRTDFYKNSDGLYKFITIRYSDIITHDFGYKLDREKYLSLKQKKGVTNDFEYQFSLYKNEYFSYENFDSKGISNLYRFIGTKNDSTNIIEYKSVAKPKEENRLVLTVGKKVKNITKYYVDVLGNIYKVSKEVLHFDL